MCYPYIVEKREGRRRGKRRCPKSAKISMAEYDKLISCKQSLRGSDPLGLFLCTEVTRMPYRKVGALEACWYMIRYKLKETFMPRIPDHPCNHPGCPQLVPRGRKYCDVHSALHPEEIRSAASRGYDRKWQRASKAYLHSHPLCAECQRHGRYVAATVVDHIVPHRGEQKLFWDESNWQPLCKRCHDQKTGREDSNPTYHY